ncbi:MAG: hypothetical protein ACLR23_22540 [Clostridia bacterium]
MSKKMSKKKKKKVLIISCFSVIMLCIVGVGGMVLKAMIDVNTAMGTMYAPVKTDNLRVDSGDSGEITHDDLIKAPKPFSVLLLGTDTGDFGRTETRGAERYDYRLHHQSGEGSRENAGAFPEIPGQKLWVEGRWTRSTMPTPLAALR